MVWKTLVGVLATVVLVEGAFIVLGRHSINRFRAVDEDSYMAFDTATGQLCRTIRRMKSTPKGVEYSPSTDHAPESRLGNSTEDKTSKGFDRIIDAIQNSPSNAEADEKYRVELIRDLPACADIR